MAISPENNETELSLLYTELYDNLTFAKKVDEQIRESTTNIDVTKMDTSFEDSTVKSSQSKVETIEARNFL